MESGTESTKYWILKNIYEFLIDRGFNIELSNFIVFFIALLFLLLLVFTLNIVIKKLSIVFKTKTKEKVNLYDILVKHRFFNRLLVLIAFTVILTTSNVLFSGFSVEWLNFELGVFRTILVIWILLVLFSMLNSWEEYLRVHPKTQRMSLKGYIQLVKIILCFISILSIISIVTGLSKSELFVALGTVTAITTLVFKDTILGFVASIELSFQDMIRPGDWIEVPSKNANGLVIDINLISVKVHNWDKSVTNVPIYSLISDSFTNWRYMEAGAGRLIQQSFNIDIDSVKRADEVFIKNISQHTLIGDSIEYLLRTPQIQNSLPETLTNLALFRTYIQHYLTQNPEINPDEWLFVRYLDKLSGDGIGLEIYAFSRKKALREYDIVQRSIVEHVIATASLFDIKLYQSPTGKDIRGISASKNKD